jgi:5,10-methylenetetrahydromethanopterin reductase
MKTPIKDMITTGKKAEEMGYTMIWVPDERFNKNPYVILAALAVNTKNILLGTGVTNPYTRNPVFTAAAIASINDLSEGRAVLGLGAGSPLVCRPLAIRQKRPVATVKKAVTVIRDLLKGGTVTVDREEFTLSKVKLDFDAGLVPIYIAGRGPQMLQLGGEVGDGVIAGAGLATPQGMTYAFSHIKGGNPDKCALDIVCWAFLSISDDEEKARDVLRPLIARIVNTVPLDTLVHIGVKKKEAVTVKQVFKEKGVFADEVVDLREYIGADLIDQFSLCGSPAYCLERVEKLIQTGVTHIGVLPFANPLYDHTEIVETFAKKVMHYV